MREYLNFSEEDIDFIKENNLDLVIDKLLIKKDLVESNINFLEDYGISNAREIFVKYAEIFLQEPTIFKNIFTKYKKDDLIERLRDNIDTVVLL